MQRYCVLKDRDPYISRVAKVLQLDYYDMDVQDLSIYDDIVYIYEPLRAKMRYRAQPVKLLFVCLTRTN